MKRSAPLRRGKPLARRAPVKRVNPDRQAKRRKAYSKYLTSPIWKAKRQQALERAGHQCEQIVTDSYVMLGRTWYCDARCIETERLTVHHLRYPRTLGEEKLDDLQVLCAHHHQLIEATQHWWRSTPRGTR